MRKKEKLLMLPPLGGLLCVAVLALVVCSGCGGSHVHQTESIELTDAIHALLVSEKLCKDTNDCIRKQLVFERPSEVIEINTYGIKDQSIAKKIIDLCIDAHVRNPRIEYELTMYAVKKPKIDLGPKPTILKLVLIKGE